MHLDQVNNVGYNRAAAGNRSLLTLILSASAALCLGSCSTASSGDLFSPDELASASAFQQQILADGVVTYAEYESAVIAQRSCLEEAGYSPGEIYQVGSSLEFTTELDVTGVADPNAASAEFDRVYAQCTVEYVRLVGTTWNESLVITDPAERDRMTREFASCLYDAGLDVNEVDGLDALMPMVQELPDDDRRVGDVQQCLESSDRLFLASVKK